MTLQLKNAEKFSQKQLSDKIYGIDLDGVCFDFVNVFSRWLKIRLNIDYSDSEIGDYYWYKTIDCLSKEDFEKEFNNFSLHNMYELLEPMPDSIKAIQYLIKNAKDIWFITGRPHSTFEQTTKALKQHFDVESDRVIFSSGSDYKSNVVNRLGIDVFIDDGPHYVDSLVENTNAKVYLMCNYPYSKKTKSKEAIRISSWNEFLEKEIS